MDFKTNLPEDHVNFVDSTEKQNKYFKIIIVLFCFYYIFVILVSFIQTPK